MTRARTARNILHFPRRQPIKTGVQVSRMADDNHLAFLRQHTGEAPERSPPARGWGHHATHGLGFAVAMAVLIWLTCAL